MGVGDEFAGCAREGVHPVGGVEAEGVPAGVPGGEGAVFFEDEVVDGVCLEEVAQGEAGLAGADDEGGFHGLRVLTAICGCFGVFRFFLPSATYFLNDLKVGKKSPLGAGPCQGTAQKYEGGRGSAAALLVKVKF